MAFTGTLDKCKACDKTVYFVDLLSADGVTYHNSCFKCSHCKGHLTMYNYSSMDGVLYCKPHFEQLFKETGTFTKKFPTVKNGERNGDVPKAPPSKVCSLFSGTQDKCASCNKTAYPLEKLTVEGESYHRTCFKCSHGGCTLTTSTYAALNGIIYCKHHFAQLFKEKGSYDHLIEVATNKNNPSEQDSETNTTEDHKPESDPESMHEQTQEQSLRHPNSTSH